MAQSLPRIEIVSATVAPVSSGTDSATHELRVTVRNAGRIPTALEQAKRVKIVRPDAIAVKFAEKSEGRVLGRQEPFWLGGGESRDLVLRLRVPAAERAITVRAESTRGGVGERRVEW
jgi:hypothetical protein